MLRKLRYVHWEGGGREGLPDFTGNPPTRRIGLSTVNVPVYSRALPSGLRMKNTTLTVRKARVTIQPPVGDSENRRKEEAFSPEMSRLGAKGSGSPLY